ncbi:MULTISPECIES: TAXI family TRAP transporter solute-binding subunit [unclassified Bradyrhizobium]|uniref:TAXI family TRAP transporter solute-binding subunit n=1 Tax=unclassified Bradyrhizobium TaxID=2631580 RepID=UPI0004266E3F|nr:MULTISPECIES: TAXI family TRAP transporter solute-binding subunit [unclassified Bradyrhizobium]MCP3464771.1 C4-dicarboxylate ABC transporter substrate-binding protein [Bradyrhizobium sp. CCGUVB23]
MVRRLLLALILPLLVVSLRTPPAAAQDAGTAQRSRGVAAHVARPAQASRPRSGEQEMRDRVNAGTVGLAAGLLEGAPLRFATEISRVVNEGGKVHVLPVVTRGPTENVNDLLYLKGIDIAIINSDSLDEYRAQVPEVGKRIVHVMNLFPSELHVFVRPEINSLAELAGKKVNFNTQGTAAAYSGPLIFSRLGIEVEKTFLPHPVALEQMLRGEMAGVVFVTSKPVDAFVKRKWGEGFKFLPVPYGPKLSDYYVQARLTPADYPALVPAGKDVETIAVPTVLVAYNWNPGTPRYDSVTAFVNELFGKLDQLRASGFDPKWKDADPAATVPGLQRLKAAESWKDGQVANRSGAP